MDRPSWDATLRIVNAAAALPELDTILTDTVAALGGNSHAFFSGTLVHDIRQEPGTIFQRPPTCLHRYPAAWQARYYAECYYKDDPIIWAGLRSVLPVRWSELERTASGRAQRIFVEAREHGLKAGFSVAVHGGARAFSMLSLTFPEEGDAVERHIDAHIHGVHLLVLHLHAAVRRIEAAAEPLSTAPALTPREQEVLRWMANGKTYGQIGQILGITERTVREHLDRAANKLGVDSKIQLVAEAVARGLTLA
ncbi:LuxR family transcriptional regulator [Azospirillum doebereinerae]